MLILAIESSCDETAVAIVENGRKVHSSKLYSQIKHHEDWGGVIPENASRLHYETAHQILDKTLTEAKVKIEDITALAVTQGPGLIGSLLVGINLAKTLAWVHNKPLIPTNHLMGHICANFLDSDLEPPFLCLLASGGHTQVIKVKDYYDMEIMGETIDDAAGEAFDKVARLMELPYPGGPNLDKLAQTGQLNSEYRFTIPKVKDYNFSFSGLKTAVLRLKQKIGDDEFLKNKADIAFMFQECVAKTLERKIAAACEDTGIKQIVIAGGVAANSKLRAHFQDVFSETNGFSLCLPALKYCTDNAAMIASAAYFKHKSQSNHDEYSNYEFDAFSRMQCNIISA
jgi:N6-L-threonylcarbamoyladenine synthase